MNKRLRNLGLISACMICSAAFAGPSLQKATTTKASTRIDFNKMIDENNNDKQDLQKSVANKMDVKPAEASADQAADKKKLMDFVDEEISIGPDRPVVDRRYNSVGEARLAPEFSTQVVALKKGDNGT